MTMKQARLSFLRSSKRIAEVSHQEPKAKRVKVAVPVPKKPVPEEPREQLKKNNAVQKLDLMNNNKSETKFSDSMKDAVKTLCKICNEAVTLTTMRGHTKSKHSLPISDYKNIHGNHRDQIIEKIYHKCGLCQQALLLDSDEIAGHLKSKHEITHKDYNSRFMNLIKEDKEKTGSKVVKSKSKNNVQTKTGVKMRSGPIEKKIEEITAQDQNQEIMSACSVENDPTIDIVEKLTIGFVDFEAGPSGQRFTPRQRIENLENLFRLQLQLQTDDDDEEDDPRSI